MKTKGHKQSSHNRQVTNATRTPLTNGVNSSATKGQAVPAPHVAPVVLVLLHTR
jgi:hypothetical protein